MAAVDRRATITFKEDIDRKIRKFAYDHECKGRTDAVNKLIMLGLSITETSDDPRRLCTPNELRLLNAYNAADHVVQDIIDRILFAQHDQSDAVKISAAINASKNKKDPEA